MPDPEYRCPHCHVNIDSVDVTVHGAVNIYTLYVDGTPKRPTFGDFDFVEAVEDEATYWSYFCPCCGGVLPGFEHVDRKTKKKKEKELLALFKKEG